MSKIKLPKGAKPSKAIGSDRLRPKLTRAYVAEPYGHRELVTTDSYILARIPVGDDVPVGPLPAEALKRIEKGEKHDVTDEGVKVTSSDGTEVVYPANGDHELPFSKPPEFQRGGDGVLEIALNPKLLAALAEALGAGNTGVRIEIPLQENGKQALRAMQVTPLNVTTDRKPTGLLMPIRPLA